jgi:hypothetical protein
MTQTYPYYVSADPTVKTDDYNIASYTWTDCVWFVLHQNQARFQAIGPFTGAEASKRARELYEAYEQGKNDLRHELRILLQAAKDEH